MPCGHSWGEIMYNAEDRHTQMLTETLRNSRWTAKHWDELASRDHPGCPPPSEKADWLYRKPTVFPLGPANFLFKRRPVMGRKWHNQEAGIERAECRRSELRCSFSGRFSWQTWIKCGQQCQHCGDPRRRKEKAPIHPPWELGGDGGCGHCLWDRLWAEIPTW